MSRRRPRGFALVITLVLLALLVLAVFALSALTKVGSEMSSASVYQTQARQNASLALSVAVGELQRHAGDDTRITGMAGITGPG
jgi:Tfp pilus assembly protein PilX